MSGSFNPSGQHGVSSSMINRSPRSFIAQQPFDSSAWDIHAAEWRAESYRGREGLFMRDGSAWLKDSRFQNGTIELDVIFNNARGFPGIAFLRIAGAPESSP